MTNLKSYLLIHSTLSKSSRIPSAPILNKAAIIFQKNLQKTLLMRS